ncbi:10026_t:CDS:10 [Entrophospora sp. SA101]|nr:10026_t:CDS:10 [Entrophospora sp. SA101]
MSKTECYFDEEEYVCPLCMEEMDISDRNFRPCPCGYQICRFCWHHIKEILNGLCPACRRVYSEQTIEFTPISPEEIKNEKKQKEREKKELEAMNRKHLANMRVVQKNLVYVIGISPKIANEEILRSHDYFGQYGKIAKIVVNRRNPPPSNVPGAPPPQPSVGVYITYVKKEDAAKAIAAVDGSVSDGKILRANYGTTKYCTYYLRNMVCQNPNCMYLHEPGEEADSYTKEDLASARYSLREHSAATESHKPNQLGKPPSSGPTPTPTPSTIIFPTHKKPDSAPSSTSTIHPSSHSNSQPSHISTHPPTHPQLTHSALHRLENDKSTTNEDKDDAPALPPTASWAAKPSSQETTPVLNKSKLKRTSPLDVQPPNSKTNKKIEPNSTNNTTTNNIINLLNTSIKKNESSDHNNNENLQLLSQPPQQLIQQIHIDSANEDKEQSKNEAKATVRDSSQSIENSIKQQKIKQKPDLVAQLDKTLSALSGGSFSFNAPLLESDPLIDDKLSDSISSIVTDSNGIINGTHIVAPPPGVGFPRTDIVSPTFTPTSDLHQQPQIHYTGSFNPFAADDDKFDVFIPESSSSSSPLTALGLPSIGGTGGGSVSSTNSYSTDPRLISHQINSNNVSSRPRHTSRFGFAQEDNDGSNLDPLSMKDLQEDLRAIFPNAKVSYGPSEIHQESMWSLANESGAFGGLPIRRSLIPTAPSSSVASINNALNQTQNLHGDNTNNVAPSIKAPPPGIYTPTPRMDYGVGATGGGWNPHNTTPWNFEEDYNIRPISLQNPNFLQGAATTATVRPARDDTQDFFGAFLKAAVGNTNTHEDIHNEDPAIMTVRFSQPGENPYRAPGAPGAPPMIPQQQYQPMQNVGAHRLSVFERVARTGEDQIGNGYGVGIGLGNVDAGGFSSMLSGRDKNLRNTASINNNNKETKKNVNIEGVVVNAKNNIDDYKSKCDDDVNSTTSKTTRTKDDESRKNFNNRPNIMTFVNEINKIKTVNDIHRLKAFNFNTDFKFDFSSSGLFYGTKSEKVDEFFITDDNKIEDLERQLANAKREALMLENRLRAVIKKNSHLQEIGRK